MEQIEFFPQTEVDFLPDLNIESGLNLTENDQTLDNKIVLQNADIFPELVKEEINSQNVELTPVNGLPSVFENQPTQNYSLYTNQNTDDFSIPRVGRTDSVSSSKNNENMMTRNGITPPSISGGSNNMSNNSISSTGQQEILNSTSNTSNNTTLYNKGTITSSGRVMMPKVGALNPIGKSFSAIKAKPQNRVLYI